MRRRLVLVALALVISAACGSSASAPSNVTPPVPQIVNPTTDEVFSNYPRTLIFQWTPVTDGNTMTYRVDWEDQLPDGTWENDTPFSGCDGIVTATSCTVSFPGKNPGRVRVQAVDSQGNASAFSAYVTFTYTV